jgi:glycosyltransferase involved in cell wall biosynthesis
VAPEKGLKLLAEAYCELRRRTPGVSIRLEVAGYLARTHTPYLEEAQGVLQREGLDQEFTYHGALDREGKLAFLRSLDVLSVPATYDEPKGLFLLEAMASGVPVVQPRRGAFVEVVERTGGGLLVHKDDASALADGLHQLWADPVGRNVLGDLAFSGVRKRYSIGASADRLIGLYGELITHGSTRLARAGAGAR